MGTIAVMYSSVWLPHLVGRGNHEDKANTLMAGSLTGEVWRFFLTKAICYQRAAVVITLLQYLLVMLIAYYLYILINRTSLVPIDLLFFV